MPEDTCAQHGQQICALFCWLKLNDIPSTLARKSSEQQIIVWAHFGTVLDAVFQRDPKPKNETVGKLKAAR